jgi:hypothetical protein
MTVVVYDGEDARDSFWSYHKSEIRRRQLPMSQHSDVPSSKKWAKVTDGANVAQSGFMKPTRPRQTQASKL